MTEVFIKVPGGTQYASVDIEANIPLPITYNILDIREPEVRQSHWSKTLKFPGTKANNILFKHIFEIGIDSTHGFNPNLKADLYILQDSIEVLRGVLKLTKITRSQNLDLIYYECNAYGGIDDLITKISDAQLTDLDFSAYNHDYTRDNQYNSWSTPIGSGYVYPMIDYAGHAPDDKIWNIKEFFPALFAKEYVDKIFEYAGKTYTSTFFDSDFFKSLIIPFNKEQYQYSDAETIAREFRAEKTADLDTRLQYPFSTPPKPGTTHNQATANIIFNNDSTGLNYDPSNLYNTGTGIWTVPAGQYGMYKIRAEGEITFRLTCDPASAVTVNHDAIIHARFLIKRNGSVIMSGGDPYTIAAGTYPNETLYGTHPIAAEVDVFLNAGDTIQVAINTYHDSSTLNGGGGFGPGTYTGTSVEIYARLEDTAFFQSSLLNVLVENAPVKLNDCIPEGVPMKDFFMSVVNMFRLYMEEDKDRANNYIIEPRNDYYLSSVVDWADKLDYEKGLEIIPMSELQAKRYIFQYKVDKDRWNEYYQKKYLRDGKPRTFGDKAIEVENDFVTADNITQPVFSATQSSSRDAITHTRVIPCMFSLDGDKIKQIGTNIRILYWSGLKSYSGQQWIHEDHTGGIGRPQGYPYAGHFDDPYNPTLDLSFGTPRELQWKIKRDLEITDANLYNTYHKRAIEEVIDPDARLVAGWFYLKPTDIFNLSFRKLYYFADEAYRLNKIIDYDLDKPKLTKCEFIKSKDPGEYVPTTRFVIGGPSTIGGGGDITPRPPEPPRDNFENLYNPQINTVVGRNNVVPTSATGILIQGDDNIIGGGAANIVVMGSGNVIYSGLENVRLIQCNGLTIAQGDQLYVNNCPVTGCLETQTSQTESIDTDSVTISATSEIVYVDTSGGPLTIYLPVYADCIFEKITIIDNTGNAFTNNMQITRSGADAILGGTTYPITVDFAVTEFWKSATPGVWLVK
jgi:hypothetical protein